VQTITIMSIFLFVFNFTIYVSLNWMFLFKQRMKNAGEA
jgi:hypothetical protein